MNDAATKTWSGLRNSEMAQPAPGFTGDRGKITLSGDFAGPFFPLTPVSAVSRGCGAQHGEAIMKYALVYGLLSGFVVAGVIVAGLAVGGHDSGIFGTLWFGYLVMLVALTFIFVGVKRYRDVERGGVIKFLPAFAMGLGIAICAGIAYACVWEIYLASTGYRFMDEYAAAIIRHRQAEGASAAELARVTADMQSLRYELRQSPVPLPDDLPGDFPGRAARRPGLGRLAAQSPPAAGHARRSGGPAHRRRLSRAYRRIHGLFNALTLRALPSHRKKSSF